MIKKVYKKKGINITVSKEAHKKLQAEGLKSVPKRSIREQVNFINNLRTDL